MKKLVILILAIFIFSGISTAEEMTKGVYAKKDSAVSKSDDQVKVESAEKETVKDEEGVDHDAYKSGDVVEPQATEEGVNKPREMPEEESYDQNSGLPNVTGSDASGEFE